MASQVEALLFDLGGVVFGLDFERAIRIWAERGRADAAVVRERFSMDGAYALHERGELDELGYFAALRLSLGLDLPDEDLRAGWRAIYTEALPGIREVLSAASAQRRLYAFTNSNPSHQAVWGARFEQELGHFRRIFVSSNLGMRKPEPASYRRVAELAGLTPSKFLFLDDTEVNVLGARDAGMAAVHVTSVGDIREALLAAGVRA